MNEPARTRRLPTVWELVSDTRRLLADRYFDLLGFLFLLFAGTMAIFILALVPQVILISARVLPLVRDSSVTIPTDLFWQVGLIVLVAFVALVLWGSAMGYGLLRTVVMSPLSSLRERLSDSRKAMLPFLWLKLLVGLILLGGMFSSCCRASTWRFRSCW